MARPVGRRLAVAAVAGGALLGAATGAPAAASPARFAEGVPPIGGARLGSAALVFGAGAPVLPKDLTASSWLVADAGSGAVLAARNPHGRFAPASTLKILTAVTLLPRLDPRRSITVTNPDETVDGTKVGLVPGSRVRVDQLFTALLVVSGNDAANVLARAGGGQTATIGLMSAQARRLQALDTVPRTVHGLDAPGQTSSAYDLALLGRAGLAMPAFRRYVATRRSWMPGRAGKRFEIDNHNRLLTRYPGAIGIKNGYTKAARSSLVAAARRGNRTVLVTLMHADARMWDQAATLLDWGFRAAGRTPAVGMLVGSAEARAAQPQPRPAALAATPPAGPAATPRGFATPAQAGALGAAVALVLAAVWSRRRRSRT